jgi:hypothetical protein
MKPESRPSIEQGLVSAVKSGGAFDHERWPINKKKRYLTTTW